MDSTHFNRIVKSFGTAASRREVLRGSVVTALGALGLGVSQAAGKGKHRRKVHAAAPRTCASCICGVGRPCNPKTTDTCVEVGLGFPSAADQCSNRCAEQGFKFCGAGSQFHCPQGCV